MDEKLAKLIKDDWNISDGDVERARERLEGYFKAMRRLEVQEFLEESWTPKKEEMSAIKEAANRKIHLTVMWLEVKEIIVAIIFAMIGFFAMIGLFGTMSTAPLIISVIVAATFGTFAWFFTMLTRPCWLSRLYHKRGMYAQSVLASAFYGEFEPLSLGEGMVRPKPAWITRFIN
ncbi:hypothetical protein M0Q50_00405 [bacterium]|nr:hypothetical protein [bacterium]